ncbi:MAG TPA: dienelactone hydrolase family protein [Polyangiaceae bacterium]|nr:dienelactone hydrolase family protein [Polyangiaceae bacterium]
MTDTSIHTPARSMPAYVATPGRPPPWPGVVLVHDAFGMTQVLRRHADWLASEGYLAAAPALFRGGGGFACVRAIFREIAAGHGPAFDDVESTRAWLVAQPGCTGRVGVIGFCMGGGFALALAARHGFAAAAPNYGRLPKHAEAVLEGACPVVASYGGKDMALKGAAAALERILDAKGVPHDVKEYPGAGHSFLDDFAPGDAPRLVMVLMKLLGQGYHEPSAVDARRRIAAFFDTHLKTVG